jgi:uncharacterized membrane protein
MPAKSGRRPKAKPRAHHATAELNVAPAETAKAPSAAEVRLAPGTTPSPDPDQCERSDSYDVFISHSHNDVEYAQALATLFESNGFLVWWDKKLLPGENYRTRIDALIASCSAVVSIWSPNALDSDWVMDEANRAREAKKLIPVRVADCLPPMGFRQIECYSLLNWSGSSPIDDVEPLLRAVKDRTSRQHGRPHADRAFAVATSQARGSRDIKTLAKRIFMPLVHLLILLLLLAVVPLIFGEFSAKIAFHAVKLLHIFSAIILLGGGLMLYLLFRAADFEADFSAEEAVTKIARRLVTTVWLPSALVQPITGLLLVYIGGFHWARWLFIAFILYFASLLLWWLGFRAAFEGSGPGPSMTFAPETLKLRAQRDNWMKWALGLNLLTFGLMVYARELPDFLSAPLQPVETMLKLVSP